MHQLKQVSPKNYSDCNKVKLIRGGREYFELLLRLINKAEVSIHLQTYIYDTDETGYLIADALKAAVKRNVQVYVLADGYASRDVSRDFIEDLVQSGIHFRFFEPLIKSKHFYFGRRMHHKIAVIDARFSLVGGINIANHYNDMPGEPSWLDFSLFSEGDIAYKLCKLCWETWNGFPSKRTRIPFKEKPPIFNFNDTETSQVRMRRNDWLRGKNEISATYKEMFRHAESQITILCSYFLPGSIMRKSLRIAAKRGVKIIVIAAERSDVMLAKHAERWLYDWLLRNNIALYEYRPTILHAKLAVCDNKWLTIGSYNINNISAYASIELNLDVNNAAFATLVNQTLETIIHDDCILISKEEHYHKKNIFNQFIRWCSYQIIRTLFYLVTFYYKRMS